MSAWNRRSYGATEPHLLSFAPGLPSVVGVPAWSDRCVGLTDATGATFARLPDAGRPDAPEQLTTLIRRAVEAGAVEPLTLVYPA